MEILSWCTRSRDMHITNASACISKLLNIYSIMNGNGLFRSEALVKLFLVTVVCLALGQNYPLCCCQKIKWLIQLCVKKISDLLSHIVEAYISVKLLKYISGQGWLRTVLRSNCKAKSLCKVFWISTNSIVSSWMMHVWPKIKKQQICMYWHWTSSQVIEKPEI